MATILTVLLSSLIIAGVSTFVIYAMSADDQTPRPNRRAHDWS